MKPAHIVGIALMALSAGEFSTAANTKPLPNIVLIMADDMGYECLGCNGSLSYKTPNLDRIAQNGIRFTHCISQPLCTPSRVKIMTGKYNYRNYEHFEYLNPNQKTFGNYLKEAGYKTCIAGKWQLNGIAHNLPSHQESNQPYHFGFGEYCLWQLNHPGKDGERYANPLIIQNGKKLEGLENAYGPDIFSDFVCNFIDQNAAIPFFVYYPMVLVHDPFVPTPDSPDWGDTANRYKQNNRHFKEMVEYADKIVGKIEAKLKEKGLLENTILIFVGDNGTNTQITSQTVQGNVKGGKSFTIDTGCHVPLIVSWPEMIKHGRVYDPIIGFHDFLPTMLEATGVRNLPKDIDGKSFVPVLKGQDSTVRQNVLVHYDPQWGKTGENRNRFVLTTEYKLYRDGRFFNYAADSLEVRPLKDLSKKEKQLKNKLQKVLDVAQQESPWPENPIVVPANKAGEK